MNFAELVQEMNFLKGLVLHSIKAGADITLVDLKVKEGTLVIRDSKGRIRSRPMTEVRKIWDALAQKPAVHVDSVLGGSGSSRNQPETIFANMPFVEYLMVDGKKYISLVQNPSHNPGTLRQMDLVMAESVKSRLANLGDSPLPWTVVIVVPDLELTVNAIESTSGIGPDSVTGEPYARQVELEGTKFLIIGLGPDGSGPLPLGVYPVIRAPSGIQAVKKSCVCGVDLWLKDVNGAKVLVSN